MSDKFNMKDKKNIAKAKNRFKTILDIKLFNQWEHIEPDIRRIISQKTFLEIQIGKNVNYDDLCNSWIYPTNLVYNGSQYVVSQTPENKFTREFNKKRNDILLKKLWEFFKFVRFRSFSAKGISAILGIVYLTHLFFLLNPWWTAKEIYEFFHQSMLLYVVLNSPKKLEVFTMSESSLLLEAFHEICMQNLILLRILCHANYHLIINLQDQANLTRKN
ncbi:uncharacterized protein LOC143349623 isoform X1 [Colletes latitarsis]|uniref:uncharacterized protein LOC143349623 isoform X1 n=1 Tax=Colletes latitarsis TaxID=2605962 RepID=UPI0040368DA5